MLRWVLIAGLVLLPPAVGVLDAQDGEAEAEESVFTARNLTPEMRAAITKVPAERSLPYRPGTRLTYKIGWGWFDVGEAVLSVEEDRYEGQAALKFTLEARTNSFADAFYKVRNTTVAWVDPQMTRTLHYTNDQNEGKRQRDVVVEFSEDGEQVRYMNRLTDDVRPFIPVLPGTWDPMAITFFVGSLPLVPGTDLVIPTTNGKEFFLTYIEVTERVRKKFRIGRREAVLLRPDIKDLGGVFEKGSDSAVRFWFAAEGPQIPLRMESEVAVGSFWAELVKMEQPPAPFSSEIGSARR